MAFIAPCTVFGVKLYAVRILISGNFVSTRNQNSDRSVEVINFSCSIEEQRFWKKVKIEKRYAWIEIARIEQIREIERERMAAIRIFEISNHAQFWNDCVNWMRLREFLEIATRPTANFTFILNKWTEMIIFIFIVNI